MRKLLLCGAAVAVTLAAGAFLSAAYANRHPDTWVGRCVLTSYKVASECTILGSTRFGSCCRSEKTGGAVAACTEQDDCCKNPCERTCTSEPGCHPLSETNGVVFKQLPMPIQIGGNEECTGDLPLINGVQPIPVQVPPATVDFEPAAPYMPRCPEDEVMIQPMPPACEGDGSSITHSLIGYWMHMIRSMGAASEIIPAVGSAEESEPFIPGNPSKCQEDPHSSEQYPGCPFMGPCPSGKGIGSPTRPENTGKSRPEGSGEKNISSPSDSELLPQSKHESNWQTPAGSIIWDSSMPSPSTNSASSATPSLHPSVDTTEFRSSDAQSGEFEPKPY